ncbi:MAG: RNA-binding protein [Planctomycetales bacterium]|nr:RNA-binding protein [Planctomycetales bacterium]
MGKKIYCGNLGYGVTNNDLEALFAEFGQVRSAEVIMDRDTGRSKGFGFVEMERDADAQSAISALNDQEHEGRPLKVNEAKPREPRSGGGGGGNRGGGGGGGRRW